MLGITTLAINPSSSTTLYAGTSGGVFKSTDGAGTWSALDTGLHDLRVTRLVVDPLTPTTLYAGTVGVFVLQQTTEGAR